MHDSLVEWNLDKLYFVIHVQVEMLFCFITISEF